MRRWSSSCSWDRRRNIFTQTDFTKYYYISPVSRWRVPASFQHLRHSRSSTESSSVTSKEKVHPNILKTHLSLSPGELWTHLDGFGIMTGSLKTPLRARSDPVQLTKYRTDIHANVSSHVHISVDDLRFMWGGAEPETAVQDLVPNFRMWNYCVSVMSRRDSSWRAVGQNPFLNKMIRLLNPCLWQWNGLKGDNEHVQLCLCLQWRMFFDETSGRFLLHL